MFIQLTTKSTLRNILININKISSIVDCNTYCEIYFTEENDYVSVLESFNEIRQKLEKLGFFKKL